MWGVKVDWVVGKVEDSDRLDGDLEDVLEKEDVVNVGICSKDGGVSSWGGYGTGSWCVVVFIFIRRMPVLSFGGNNWEDVDRVGYRLMEWWEAIRPKPV